MGKCSDFLVTGFFKLLKIVIMLQVSQFFKFLIPFTFIVKIIFVAAKTGKFPLTNNFFALKKINTNDLGF